MDAKYEAAPELTVIVTVYKRLEYLDTALKSLRNQTCHLFDAIVTDDSNNSEIAQICSRFDKGSVRYRANPIPLGVAENVRLVAQGASTEYIAILNDDDCWEPEYVESLLLPLQKNPNAVLAFGDHWIIDAEGRIDVAASDRNTIHYRRHLLREGVLTDWISEAVIDQSIPLAMAAVFRKNAINWALVDSEVGGAYDFWIACLLAATRRPAIYVNRRLSRYRIHEAMETARQAFDKNQEMVAIWDRIIRWNFFSEFKCPIERKFAQTLLTSGRYSLVFGRRSEARAYFARSFRILWNAKAIAGVIFTIPPFNLLFRCLKFISRHARRIIYKIPPRTRLKTTGEARATDNA